MKYQDRNPAQSTISCPCACFYKNVNYKRDGNKKDEHALALTTMFQIISLSLSKPISAKILEIFDGVA